MNGSPQQNEPCGIRLMRLMDTRLLDLIRREHNNRNTVHLYGTGGYWAAFEQSAYLLCRIFPTSEISVVTHPLYPFPVVMAHIADRELKAYSRQHIFKRDEADYKEFVAARICDKQYQLWHRNEVREYL